jgi:peptidoglycan/LPS O-acetylase OafA/YrhL
MMSLRRRHVPGLDGIRALAVVAVILYHLGYGWAKGGYLGVDLFFVLSGFLITSLLLEERHETGRIQLLEFWRRRARRLLPALYVMVAVAVLYPLIITELGRGYAVAGIDIDQLRGMAFASLFYYANWFVITSGHSYFAALSAPSPLAHTWSLAIEEQFYLLWPLVTLFLAAKGLVQRRRLGVAFCIAIAMVSSALMALQFQPGNDSSANYVYNASYTRLFDLAIGAALAWLTAGREPATRAPWWLTTAGVAGGVGLLYAMYAASNGQEPTNFMFEGGFFLCALAAGALIAAVRIEGSPIARVFSWRPFQAIGKVSYGAYLWHWPILVFVTATATGLTGAGLLSVRVLLLLLLVPASYFFIEKPIRERRFQLNVRRAVASVGTVGTVAVVAIFTIPSFYPTVNVRSELALYAPTNPPSGSGGAVGSIDRTFESTNPIGPHNHLRVMIMGDSVPSFSASGLRAVFDAMPNTRAAVRAFPTYGIRERSMWPFYFDTVHSFNPQIVVIMDVWDQGMARRHPTKYASLLQGFTTALYANGVQAVVFADLPAESPPSSLNLSAARAAFLTHRYRQSDLAWRHLVLNFVAAHPGHAVYLPLGATLEIDGKYATWIAPPRHPNEPMGNWDRVRMTDGVHLCPVGTEIYGAAMAYDLATLLDVAPPQGRWWSKPWPVVHYLFPVETATWCPLDHP